MEEDKKSLLNTVKRANRKARINEIKEAESYNDVVRQANELQAAAQELNGNARIIFTKPKKNRARFVQIVQENLQYLLDNNQLTNAELSFLMKISPKVEFLSNCLVYKVSDNVFESHTVDTLHKELGITRTSCSTMVNSLIEKGIISKAFTGENAKKAVNYSLFVNPHLMVSGDKDKINETLMRLFKNVPGPMKKLPIKFF